MTDRRDLQLKAGGNNHLRQQANLPQKNAWEWKILVSLKGNDEKQEIMIDEIAVFLIPFVISIISLSLPNLLFINPL